MAEYDEERRKVAISSRPSRSGYQRQYSNRGYDDEYEEEETSGDYGEYSDDEDYYEGSGSSYWEDEEDGDYYGSGSGDGCDDEDGCSSDGTSQVYVTEPPPVATSSSSEARQTDGKAETSDRPCSREMFISRNGTYSETGSCGRRERAAVCKNDNMTTNNSNNLV